MSNRLYADQLIYQFIQQNLQGYTTRLEWRLLDLVAVKITRSKYHLHGDDEGTPFIEAETHAFEFKSDHDNVYKIFEELPSYVWFVDHVWLVLGEHVAVPKRLPKWLGIYKYNGQTFDKIYEPERDQWGVYDYRFGNRKAIYLAEYALPGKQYDHSEYGKFNWHFLQRVLQKWFVNSLLEQKGKEKAMPYSAAEKAFITYLRNVGQFIDAEKLAFIGKKKNLEPISDDQLLKLLPKKLDEFFPIPTIEGKNNV